MTMETIGKLDSECATLQEENLKLQSEFHSLWSVKMHDNFVPKRYVRFTGLLHIEILKAVFEFVSLLCTRISICNPTIPAIYNGVDEAVTGQSLTGF